MRLDFESFYWFLNIQAITVLINTTALLEWHFQSICGTLKNPVCNTINVDYFCKQKGTKSVFSNLGQKMHRQRTAKYEKVSQNSDDEEEENVQVTIQNGEPSKKFKKTLNFLPEQFKFQIERPVPWKAIIYAAILFVLGLILLLCGCLIHIDRVDNTVSDKIWPFHKRRLK